MVDPVVGAAAVGGVAIVSAAAYSYFTGNESSAGADIDNDGEDEINVDFGGDEATDEEVEEAVERVEQPEAPEHVTEKAGLTDVKGVGPTRAEKLDKAGFPDPSDLYYASDENLTDVDGIGAYTVEQIREDIGSIEGNQSGGRGAEPEADSQDFSDPEGSAQSRDSETPDESEAQDSTDEQSDSNGSSEDESAATEE